MQNFYLQIMVIETFCIINFFLIFKRRIYITQIVHLNLFLIRSIDLNVREILCAEDKRRSVQAVNRKIFVGTCHVGLIQGYLTTECKTMRSPTALMCKRNQHTQVAI